VTIDANIPLIAMVRTEIDATFKRVHELLNRYLDTASGEDTLASGAAQVHQVWGALRMVRMEGATRLCEEIDAALHAAPDKSRLELANRALVALKDFVNDVAAGGSNAPVQLSVLYRELARAGGKDTASEKDLFFPDAGLDAPAHPAPRSLPAAELSAFLQAQRTRYQRGLLAWLKQPDDAAGLAQMREVLDSIDQVSTDLPAPRALWWAAVGMIDGLLYKPAAEWAARVKPVCSKIDFLLRDLAAKNLAATAPVQRDVLYAVATCRPLTPRLREARKLFQLDSLIPHALHGDSDAGAERLKPIIEEARTRLENIKDTWAEYVSGEPKRLERFRELLPGLQEKAAELGNAQFTHLLERIAAVVPRLPDPYPLDGQVMSVEMASALLMAQSILEQFHALPDDLEQQIMIMNGWLVDAVQGKTSTSSPPGLRADLVQQANDAKLRMATAREVLKNLARVEKTLETFSHDLTQRDALPSLKPALQQIHGVFEVLGYKRATSLLALCERLIARCADPAYHEVSQDLEWIAEGLGSIGFYLEPSLHGRPPAERAINIFFNRYDQYSGAAVTTAPAITTSTAVTPVAATARKPGTPSPPAALDATMVIRSRAKPDDEMLEVFLEEANEVLAAIDDGIRAARKNTGDKDALLTVRRGFHTLKGGGRMVGLVTLGETAWELEQVMNLWLEESRAATPALLDLAADARAMFAQWVYELQDNIDPIIDPSRIAARARALRAGTPLRAEEPLAPDTATPAGSYMTLAMSASAAAAPAAEEPVDFMTISIPAKTAAASAPAASADTPLATTTDFMTIKVPAAVPVAPVSTPEPQAETFEQALTDLGDRLAWLNGLLDEMKIEAGTLTPASARVIELTQMMTESMDEATSLQRVLAEQIAALKNNS